CEGHRAGAGRPPRRTYFVSRLTELCSDQTKALISSRMWCGRESVSNDGSRFGDRATTGNPSGVIKFARETYETREIRMSDRQQHLVAAAEALRTWVYAQRGMGAKGYPQSLVHAQPPLPAAPAAVIAPSAALAVADAPALETWPATGFEPPASPPIAD